MAFMKFSKGKKIYSVPNGLGDGSAYFSQTEGVIANVDNLPYGNSARTISCWVYPTQTNPFNSTMDFFSYGYPSTNNRYGLGIAKDFTSFRVFGYSNTTTYNYSVELKKWYHIVFTFDTDYTEKCYVNGELIGTQTHSNINTLQGSATIGRTTGDDSTSCFYGNIKNVQIYNRVLSAEEVTQLYNKQEITSGRVLNIPLQYGKDDESIFTSKSFIYDYSILTTSSGFDEFGYPIRYDIASEAGINYSPMLVKDGLVFYAPLQKDIAPIIGNAPSLSGDAIFGEVNGVKCLQCNGNTRIDYPQTDDLPTGNAPRSMSAWVSTITNSNWNFICGFGGDNSQTTSFTFNSGRIHFYNGPIEQQMSLTSYPFDNSWVHVLVTFDGTTIKGYINGVQTKEFKYTFSTTNRSVYLGYLATQNGFNYKGNVTSFRIYNRVLTDKEIQQLAKEF